MNLLINGNAKRIPLADKSVNLIFTSPPYFGLRSYKTSRWVGGDPFCEHVKNPNATKKMGNPEFNKNRPSREATKMKGYYYEDVCEKCGAPWERVVESKASTPGQNIGYNARTGTRNDGDRAGHWVDGKSETIGWRPTCDCNADTRPGIVLDPFIGSGTTAMVARKHGCKAIGLDLSFEYLNKNARERLVYGDFVYDKKGNKQFTMGV